MKETSLPGETKNTKRQKGTAKVLRSRPWLVELLLILILIFGVYARFVMHECRVCLLWYGTIKTFEPRIVPQKSENQKKRPSKT